MMGTITHILYDLGNTLIYFDGHWPEVFDRAAAALGRSAERLRLTSADDQLAARFRDAMQAYYDSREETLVERTTADILSEVLAGLEINSGGDPVLKAMLSAFYHVTQSHWQPDLTARQTLFALRERGYAQGVLSNAAYDRDVQELVDKAGLRPALDFVLSSAAIGFRKPHPEAFQAALRRWKVDPACVLMVGDTPDADILGAARSGIRSVWVRAHAQPGTDGRIRPDHTIERIDELVNLLD